MARKPPDLRTAEAAVPTALDVLDPAPAGPPAPEAPAPAAPAAKPKPYRKGLVELGVQRDLAELPEKLRKGGTAAAVLQLARELDTHLVAGRDAAGHAREIRLALAQLAEMSPSGAKADTTDEVRARREQRLNRAAAAAPE